MQRSVHSKRSAGGCIASAAVLFWVLLFPGLPRSGLAQAPVLRVELDGRLERIKLVELDSRQWLPLAPVCRLLGLQLALEVETSIVSVSGAGGRASMSPGSLRVLVGELFLPLTAPPRLLQGEFFVPLDFLPRVAAHLLGRRIELQGLRATVLAAAPAAPQEPAEPLVPRPVLTVVLDPGHGGKDNGATGKTGLTEKEVALEVCLAVKRRLEKDPAFRVVLTREDDSFLDLPARTAVANERGDCFVSVHLNAGQREGAQGFEVYSMSPRASDKEALAASRFENQVPSAAAMPQSLEPVLWDIAHNDYVNESAVFAETMVSTLSAQLHGANRGAKQAPFLVLAGATVPAILVEMAFISNLDQEALLRTTDYRDTLAEAISAGISAYLERYRNKYGGLAAGP